VDEFLHKVGDKQHPGNHESHWEGKSDAVEITGEEEDLRLAGGGYICDP